jgi:DNA modification methylase
MNSFSQRNIEFTEGIEHPTQKPIALVAKLIKNSTLPGQVVADFCGGSGSTLIACEQTNRCCRTMELDPRYASLILERYEKMTQNSVTKL